MKIITFKNPTEKSKALRFSFYLNPTFSTVKTEHQISYHYTYGYHGIETLILTIMTASNYYDRQSADETFGHTEQI